nr:15970_t:CDS:2 [Entrophospora candida]
MSKATTAPDLSSPSNNPSATITIEASELLNQEKPNNDDFMQNTFGAVYSSLASSLSKSFEVIKTMNSAMEQFLLSNLQIFQHLEYNEKNYSGLLLITISNKSPIPISNICCELIFETINEQIIIDPDLEHVEALVQDLKDRSSTRVTYSIFNKSKLDAGLSSSSSPKNFTLSPLTEIVEKLRIMESNIIKGNNIYARVIIRFPSPGTNKELCKEHRFLIEWANHENNII